MNNIAANFKSVMSIYCSKHTLAKHASNTWVCAKCVQLYTKINFK